jgi:uroporphyrin-III C-methyltransferase / precorrin-2 dehydrogenase / sirohydrochlorin ferrochelatase
VGFVFYSAEERAMAEELFAAFLKLAGRACLVVGAGKVAESKIESLLRCGAQVRVVAPQASEAVQRAAREGRLSWEAREFEANDLTGAFLVIAATSSPQLHERIFAQARQQGILCNAVDEPERCDFYYGAVVRRHPLQIAISTSGHAPVLAQHIRKELEAHFGPEYAAWTEQLGRARSEMIETGLPATERLSQLQALCAAGPEASTRGGRDVEPAGKVFFVGAGPGDPDLLTRKAWQLLQTADVVLHDALVSPKILALAGPRAELIDVGKRCGQPSATQQQIHEQLIAQAGAGRVVVRLQGGDPLIFGRAGEEMSALRAAGIAFEIVPGVTSASAAAAAAQISLTDRQVASQLIFLSAHRRNGEFTIDWQAVARPDATLAIYMPGHNYERIAGELLKAGLPATTPCVIVSQASTPAELILRVELASLPELPEPPAPALLIVGEVTRAEAAEAAAAWNSGGVALAGQEKEALG